MPTNSDFEAKLRTFTAKTLSSLRSIILAGFLVFLAALGVFPVEMPLKTKTLYLDTKNTCLLPRLT